MTDDTQSGDRIAKVIARAGLASRRDAEGMVTDLRVKVNGRTVSNVAMNVTPADRITVDGQPLPQAEGARLWLYHKPAGLVTTARDEKGRETVFDTLPAEMGRVMSIGRLDLTSEGLLLLTNDGGLKRQLELPATGWLRRYRVRVNGRPEEAALDRVRAGITVTDEDGTETFAPMQVALDRQQGANAWLTVGLREGRNREIRRAMAAVSLYVNRLIRVSYGPFQLGNLVAGAIEEVRPRVLREQLGATFDGELAESRKGTAMAEDDEKPSGGKSGRKSGERPGGARPPRAAGDRLVDKGRGAPQGDRPRGDRPRDDRPRGDGPQGKGPQGKGPQGKGPRGSAPQGDRPRGKPQGGRPYARDAAEAGSERAARPGRPHTAKPPVTRSDSDGARPARGARPSRAGEGKPFRRDGDRPARPGEARPRDGEHKPFRRDDDRPPRKDGERKPFRKDDDRPARKDGERAPYKRDVERPARDGAKPGGRPDRRPQASDKPKETRGERNIRLRSDTSVSLRKGGQKGRGIDKPKKPVSTKRMRKPGEEKDGGED